MADEKLHKYSQTLDIARENRRHMRETPDKLSMQLFHHLMPLEAKLHHSIRVGSEIRKTEVEEFPEELEGCQRQSCNVKPLLSTFSQTLPQGSLRDQSFFQENRNSPKFLL